MLSSANISAQVVAGPENLPRHSTLSLPGVTDVCGLLLFDLNQIVFELIQRSPMQRQ